MRKVSCEAPAEASCVSFFESASLLSSVPSMHRAMTAPPLGSFSSMSAASLASACSISAGAGLGELLLRQLHDLQLAVAL